MRDAERIFQDHLEDLLCDGVRTSDVFEPEIKVVRTFEDVGVLTRNAGLVVRLQDGSEFQITIVQSKAGEHDADDDDEDPVDE